MRVPVDQDFETRSAVKLTDVGADRYAQHPTTEVITLHVHDPWHGDFVWHPGDPIDVLAQLAHDPNTVFVAHGAGFEQAIWREHMVKWFGLPEIPIERWDCTMAAAYHRGLPGGLEPALEALELPVGKDLEGRKLTLALSKYGKDGNWPELDAETLARVDAYCHQDVVAERALRKRIGLLSQINEFERKIWIRNQRMNQRGLLIDVPFVKAAKEVVRKASIPLLTEFDKLTGGLVPTQREKVQAWLTGRGVPVEDMRKETLERLDKKALPEDVQRVLYIRSQICSSSIAKLDTMLAARCEDGRVRGTVQYHAAHTGREGGRLLQPQNFPRGIIPLKDLGLTPDGVVWAIMSQDPGTVEEVCKVPAHDAVASSLRYALMAAPGHVYKAGDFAGIEMRIVLALAGQHDKCELLATGKDVYLDMACDIYGVPRGSLDKDRDKEKRQVGKNTVLGCGFGMGPGKFHERYCPDQPPSFAEHVVRAYRQEWAPKVPDLWKALDDAVLECVKTGEFTVAANCIFRLEDRWLTISLPNGWQKLWYLDPAVEREVEFDRVCVTYSDCSNGGSRRTKLYGGHICENVVQALARGLLEDAVERIEQADWPVVLKVHDEIVVEVPEGRADIRRFEEIMAHSPRWASDMGIPIAVETWQGTRYRK